MRSLRVTLYQARIDHKSIYANILELAPKKFELQAKDYSIALIMNENDEKLRSLRFEIDSARKGAGARISYPFNRNMM